MNPSNGPSNGKPSFFDRNTLIAFAIIIVFWIGWQRYMESKNPPASTAEQQQAQGTPGSATSGTPAALGATGEVQGNSAAPADTLEAATGSVAESFVEFSDDKLSFQVSSKGMGLKDINIKSYKTRSGEPVYLAHVDANYPFTTRLVGTSAPIDFAIEKVDATTFVGRGSLNGMQIEKTMKVNPSTYSIETHVKVTGASAGAFTGVSTLLTDNLYETKAAGMFGPAADHQNWFIKHDDTKLRHQIDRAKGFDVSASNVKVAALGEHYFTIALADHSDILPRFETKAAPNTAIAQGLVIHQPINPVNEFNVKYVAFAGPKDFEILSKVDENLAQVIDYGTFAILAKPMLWLLKFLHSLVGNWGWAIVLLTIIVRFIVLPFNVYSFKSMKVMQKIQPEMTRIREKYKDKPADQKLQMNQEIMTLMKSHKANPLGGCIPMLFQIPVFIALWQVLGQSIELYQAPYMLWIHDLSVRDPYFVLPVLMGITMFIQQKITPTTMDPQQAKIMMLMPVIFSVFMISLPSGLTLYMFVSALFGIIQQYVFMRDKTSAKTVREAKA